jgi:hypothetical protein
MQQSKLEAVTRFFPELQLENFLNLPTCGQMKALDTALDNLRNLKSEQSRLIKGAIALAIQDLALSFEVTADVRGKCLDILEFWRNPF